MRLLLASARTTPPGVATRDATLWPFASDSPWNRPVGSAAVFVDHSVLRTEGASINRTAWTIPVSIHNPANPLVSFTQNSECGGGGASSTPPPSIRIASGVTGSPPVCTGSNYRDGFLIAIHSDGIAYGFTRATRVSDSTMRYGYHRNASYDDIITGSGWKPDRGWTGGGHWIAGSSLLGGLMRTWELDAIQNGTMSYAPHALQCTLPYAMIKKSTGTIDSTWVWPAVWADGDGSGYIGTIPMGGLLAIQPNFDIEATGWTFQAKALARTLQKYGVYVIGQGGGTQGQSGGHMTLEFELNAPATPTSAMTTNINAIRDQLRVVSNNGPSSVGGGGSYPSPLWPIPDPVYGI